MRVHVSARLDEGLVALIVERASVEQRSLTNMLERLLSLGLGQVVTERDEMIAQVPEGVAAQEGKVQEGLRPDRASRSVTICANERFHRPGVFCKACERVL